MSNRKPLLNLLMLCLIAILLSACGGSSATPTAAPPTPAPASVTNDVPYTIPLQPGGRASLADIYAPISPGDLPSVVISTFHPEQRNLPAYVELAYAIAARGAVVFVVDITSAPYPDLFTSPGGAGARRDAEVTACAIRFARANAARHGGRSDTVVFIGHTQAGYNGMWQALVGDEVDRVWDDFAASHGGAPRQVDCTASRDTSARVDAFIGFSGAYTIYNDAELPDNPDRVAVLNPATYIGRNTDVFLRLLPAKSEVVVPKWVVELNEQFYQDLLAAGHDVTWTVVDTTHIDRIDAKAREAILEAFDEATSR
jgi:hypothetical protein